MGRRLSLILAVAGIAAAALALTRSATPADAAGECGLPGSRPLWIEYAQGGVKPEVREVFSRPGVVVATSGTSLPAELRKRGAATMFFELKLTRHVGTPAAPADPSVIEVVADGLYERAAEETDCARPWMALNELNGPAAKTPWTATTATYRANVLALLQRLNERGARPVLLVHGNPNVNGAAADWWRAVGRVAHIAYQSYFNAAKLDKLGRILGPRRVRFGMRAAVKRFAQIRIPKRQIGLVLGFQVAQGKMGREGLQPRESWFRVVKWNTLAAKQIAGELGLSTVWSWGWGTFGPESDDPDKPTAACVHLWSHTPSLCNAPAVAGPSFNRSRVEGIILVPKGVRCISASGRLRQATVDGLRAVVGDFRLALDASFSRKAVQRLVPVTAAETAAAEQEVIDRAFGGSRDAYLEALTTRKATPAIARAVLADALARERIAQSLQPGQTVLEWIADTTSAEVDTATCLRDNIPGISEFPRTDARDVPVVPLPASLPFLLDDSTPPAVPGSVTISVGANGWTLDWADVPDADLGGYDVYRVDETGATRRLNSRLLIRSALRLPATPGADYVIRAVDTSLNESEPSAPAVPAAQPAS